MYAIYGNIYHQYTPVMLALIYHTWILWEMVTPKWSLFQAVSVFQTWKNWINGNPRDPAGSAPHSCCEVLLTPHLPPARWAVARRSPRPSCWRLGDVPRIFNYSHFFGGSTVVAIGNGVFPDLIYIMEIENVCFCLVFLAQKENRSRRCLRLVVWLLSFLPDRRRPKGHLSLWRPSHVLPQRPWPAVLLGPSTSVAWQCSRPPRCSQPCAACRTVPSPWDEVRRGRFVGQMRGNGTPKNEECFSADDDNMC